MGEGTDIQSLQYVINARAEKSNIMTIQLLGRVMRIDPSNPNKTSATFIDIMDSNIKWLKEHSKERLDIYNSDPKAYRVKNVKSSKELI